MCYVTISTPTCQFTCVGVCVCLLGVGWGGGVDRFYIVLFSTLKQTHCACMWFYISDSLFIACFWISTKVVYLQRCLILTWLVPRETDAILACSLYTVRQRTVSRHFMQIHIHRVHACLAVTCHLHLWQNDQDLLCVTAVTQGWNRYWNESQYRKLTTENVCVWGRERVCECVCMCVCV